MTKSPSQPVRRRLLQCLLLSVVLLIFAVVAWRVWFNGKPDHGFADHMMAETIVHAGVVGSADVPVYLDAPATVVPSDNVTVTSRIDGQLTQVLFVEGQQVKAGELLAQLDDRTYQANLAQYQGALAEHQAQLRSAELTLARYRKLYAQDSLSRQNLESQIAAVGQYRGAVQQDQAQINGAKININYARITAPISGRIGLRKVDVGNMVRSSDSTGIATITQMQPAAVSFAVPQQYIKQLTSTLNQGVALPATALDQDNQTPLAQGEVRYISNSIDTATGTIAMKALFDNSDEALYANQFVNLRLQIDLLKQAVVAPAQAVQLSNEGNFVFVIGQDNSVTRQIIETGPMVGEDRQVVLSGLKPGDRVVTQGIDRLTNGDKVMVAEAPSEPQTSHQSSNASAKASR